MSIDSHSLLELHEQKMEQSRWGGEELRGEASSPLEGQDWSQEILSRTRRFLGEEQFCHQHRINDKAFTRKRRFTFPNSMLFLMQKTVRAIQTHIHSFFEDSGQPSPELTPSAWSRARAKLSHTVFSALNEEAILKVIYADYAHPQLRLWKGFRLSAIDSSLVRLPNQEKLGQEFGWVESKNQSGLCGRFPEARLSILTDLLNRIGIHTCFEPSSTGERELALKHLKRLEAWDLTIFDRGYAEYKLWACWVKAQRLFVCRCQASSFSIVNRLFEANQAGCSVVVELTPHHDNRQEVQEAGLPMKIKVRFVTVRLKTGELEVLATNLLDEALYPTDCFEELYHYRWIIETYYGLLKGRLDLGHFTGLTSKAIRQDVYSTVFVSNLESILIDPANQQLEEKSQSLKNRQQVNHAVSFHTIKTQILKLLTGQEPIPQVLKTIQHYFLANPTSVRPDRIIPRTKPSACKSHYFQRNVKKVVY